VLAESQTIRIRAGQTFAAAGEPIVSAFFPVSGVVYFVSEMTTGHQVSVAAVGSEGLIGAAALVGIPRHAYRIVAVLECEGYRVPAASLRRAFQEREGFRSAALADIGRQWNEAASLLACSRVHSHRERVARWLLMTMDKSRQSSLPLTHDELARMVGGARHAVTVVLNALRREGAVAHARGRIDIIDRTQLLRHACGCHSAIERAHRSQRNR
jgi:CRP-like cAMP-binding protein